MKNEFALAFNEVIEEKQLPREVILQALEAAMVHAYKKAVNAPNAQIIEAKVDPDTGRVTIFAEKEIVDSVQDDRTEITITKAKEVNNDAILGDMIMMESTPKDFGRVAAQTARQVIQQQIRDAERRAQLEYYQKQVGEIVSGVVQARNSQGLTIGLEMRAEGHMAHKDTIPGERMHVHDRVRTLIAEAKDSPRGPQIILSRTHRDFLRRLLENEVPEIYHGVVEIRSISREPGQRAKVAVSAMQSGIDPVGACVGIRGVRIQAIVKELHGEKIDVIEWSSDPGVFIAKAISPARVVGVYPTDLNEQGKTAMVVVPEDQLSLAIGRDGQNARLAAKLTGWRIDIKSLGEAASDALLSLQDQENLALIADAEKEIVPQVEQIIIKKSEGRPISPEEYNVIAQFVDRVERRTALKLETEKKEEDARINEARRCIDPASFNVDILDSGLKEHIAVIIQGSGIENMGDLALKIKMDPDSVLSLQGIGPKAMETINQIVNELTIDPEDILEVKEEIQEEAAIEEAKEEIQVQDTKVEETKEEQAPDTIVEAKEEIEAILDTAISEDSAKDAMAKETIVVENKESKETETPVEDEDKEEDLSFDELFELKSDMIKPVDFAEEEDDVIDNQTHSTKKKKKKKKHVEIEYDPDQDFTYVKKKHKRAEDDWNW